MLRLLPMVLVLSWFLLSVFFAILANLINILRFVIIQLVSNIVNKFGSKLLQR